MAGPLQGRATYSSCQPLLQIAPPTIRSTAPVKLLKLASNVLLYQGNVAHETNEQPRLEHPQWNRNGVLVEEGGDEKHDRDRCATRPTWWITDLHDDVFFGKTCCKKRFIDMPKEPSMHWQIPVLPKLWKVCGIPPIVVEVSIGKIEQFPRDV